MRAELEALSAHEAAGRVTESDLRELHELNDEIARARAAGTTIATLRDLDARFHTRLRAVARMPHPAQTLKNLADQCEGYLARLLDERPQLVPTAERHAGLLAALARQDPVAAAEAMREHILSGMRAVLANLDEGAEEGVAGGEGERTPSPPEAAGPAPPEAKPAPPSAP